MHIIRQAVGQEGRRGLLAAPPGGHLREPGGRSLPGGEGSPHQQHRPGEAFCPPLGRRLRRAANSHLPPIARGRYQVKSCKISNKIHCFKTHELYDVLAVDLGFNIFYYCQDTIAILLNVKKIQL